MESRSPGYRHCLSAVTALAVSVLSTTACNDRDSLPLAVGDVNSIIVTTSPELWAQIEPTLLPTLERRVFTVRDERTFKVTYQTAEEEVWYRLRLLKQQLVIGTPDDPWIAPALARVDEPVSPPRILQVADVWAREQLVTMVVLADETDAAETIEGLLPELADQFDSQYRDWVLARMFTTGPDTALARTLREDHRFSLVVPAVYQYRTLDGIHMFRNDNPDPSELIRQFAVTWQSPAVELDTDALLEWRARIVDQYYNYPQFLNLRRTIESRGLFRGNPVLSVQAVWENPPDEYPAAGPFITRSVTCADQDRTYLIDAWLYAPDREKYEYMIQLEQILGSFQCT
ncbi:MAG: DUF4837 family protein [Gemmatimonadetes bacterium]|nr:DUF4837 family protein [Gemmatimonadota bacterium]MCY3677861.1 DUF4837 family protein [Gemmatimonadota bacterium]MYA42912.1 DUF4837 family protein [Gemmatimonadota bacterium]MYE93739.1 DUF4837 family protein [Gemmatimonadota bacterium]MYJ09410.1 DUF4837 family protein [Gemmatimonadota bacterium]